MFDELYYDTLRNCESENIDIFNDENGGIKWIDDIVVIVIVAAAASASTPTTD